SSGRRGTLGSSAAVRTRSNGSETGYVGSRSLDRTTPSVESHVEDPGSHRVHLADLRRTLRLGPDGKPTNAGRGAAAAGPRCAGQGPCGRESGAAKVTAYSPRYSRL